MTRASDDEVASERAAPGPAALQVSGARHWLGFLASGGGAFVIDAAVLKLLTAFAGWPPLAARPPAIALAMIGGWLGHRTFTFALKTPPTLAEFARYAAVGWLSAAVNYALFAVLLLAWPRLDPFAALVASSAAAMVVAYLGMRFGAFARRP